MGWTVFRPVNNDWFINRKFREHADVDLLASLPHRDAAISEAMQYLDDHHLLSGEAEELEQFRMFYSMIANRLPELGLSKDAVDEIAQCKVFDTDNYIFYDGVKAVFEELRRDYKLGIISDTWPSIERILGSAGLSELFDVKVYSYQHGVSKPHPRLYETALARMGLPARQTVFIDDWEPNLDAADALGIQPVLMTTRTDAPNSGKYPNIGHISELEKLLRF